MLATVSAADLDQGPRTVRSGTERMCALTRQVMPIHDMIRFVVGPADEVVPDLKRKLPGRGLWLSTSRSAVEEAAKRGVFSKGFKRSVRVAPSLADDTEALLVRGLIEALAMAAKAGQAVSGFSKVERCLGEGRAQVLIHAADGAADGIRKLDGAARAARDGGSPLPVIDSLNSDELDLALGRSNVIHAALTAGPANELVLSRCRALVQYRIAAGETFRAKAMPKSTNKATNKTGRTVPQGAMEHD